MQFLELSIFVTCFLLGFGHSARELARGKQTNASYLLFPSTGAIWDSSKVVDGDINTNVFCNSCLHTASEKSNAWWQVELGGLYTINRVEIYSREPYVGTTCPSMKVENPPHPNEDSDRLKSYYIYISNTSTWATGDRCYKESSGIGEYPDLYQNNSCVGYGSYLTIYTSHWATAGSANGACLTICEVRVYGCEDGFYGNNCTEPCSRHCVGNTCDPDTGFCFECKDGWLADTCNEPCVEYLYGRNCSKMCGNCKDGVPCVNTNGTCPNGCSNGWIGGTCDQACPDHFYGRDCGTPCGECWNDEPCIHTNGSCSMGCKIGYSGDRCFKCPEGTFGLNCGEVCGNCVHGDTCHHVTGECTNGCSDGWLDRHCNRSCDLYTYGKNCNNSCGLCSNNEPCIHTNGSCPSGCADGYTGQQCVSRCPDGTYGTDCKGVCGNCINASDCHHVTGLCLSNSCQAGWLGSDCKTGKEASSSSDHNNGIVIALSVLAVVTTLAFCTVLLILITLVRKLPSDQVKKIKNEYFSFPRQSKYKNDSAYETTSAPATDMNKTEDLHLYQTIDTSVKRM